MCVALLSVGVVHGQTLQRVIRFTDNFPESIWFDPVDSLLYMGVGGTASVEGQANTGLIRWDGMNWTTIPCLDSPTLQSRWIHHLHGFDGRLFIGGTFYYVDGIGSLGRAAAQYHNGAWESAGEPNSPMRFDLINGELWAFGAFDTLFGQYSSSLVQWQNPQWQMLGGPIPYGGEVRAAEMYNGQLVIGGNLTAFPVQQEVRVWDGTEWAQLGTGVDGNGFQWVNSLANFQGKLYAGGVLNTSNGNVGQHLVVWDGTSWGPFFPNVVESTTGVSDMEVIDGRLYIAGAFRFYGDNKNYHLLQFDGTNLCAVGKDLTMANAL